MRKDENPRFINNANFRQKPAIREDDTFTTETKGERTKENTDNVSTYEPRTETDQIRAIASSLGEDGEKKLVQILVEQRQWKGLLPDPVTFNKYPEDIRNEIIKWNDVSIVNASAREDDLVKNFIACKTREQYFSFFLNLVIVIISSVAFLLTNDPICFSVLSVPVLTVVVNVWKEIKNDKDE